ncbi:DUF3566 domain-containing protein [Brachybacterium saurashtrense]|uniref:DUF3566 domain-containing protein n=1 Tax=Brachybacterium saurashtrense TaxID=556288 RepID=A0A345YRR2_9MICO|nr:DUF3566 domain-containing protein [Brachybacterium saurashtrense]AXK46614.1 DUF3566 domain-containing protein [Brachybacterium saurashtrense]RRR20758.1 DUF3566 domain-containing protein [Brachybacterium saurashtrense]RRR24355.1 DUF3566 domain-containing protein [Brachybacterium saurashtrense]
MSTSDSRTTTGSADPAESTSTLPAFDGTSSPSTSSAEPAPTTGETSMGAGRGSASRGASRSPKKTPPLAAAAETERRGPRRVRLTLARLDPFSVMKLSFLAAIAIGIATVVAVILLWNLVEAIGLWSQIDQLGRDLNGGDPLPFMEFFSFSKMTSYGTIVAVVNVVIITALGTLLAFLYNLVAALLGGLKMTFTDE